MDIEVSQRQTILAVDDTRDNLVLLSEILKDRYRIKLATSGSKALQIAQTAPVPDLILLDVMMPEMDGYECCRQLKENPITADIPVIFLTAKIAIDDERQGLKLGAADYIGKPISPPIVEARVEAHLLAANARRFLKDKSAYLEALVAARTRELATMQDATIVAMGTLAEQRDNETGNHIRRTQNYVAALGRKLQTNPRFAPMLSNEVVDTLFKVAPLHDIGKVGVPDYILHKPGKLDPVEWEEMKRHAEYGGNAIREVERSVGTTTLFLTLGREIAECHHEKWDGSGYPKGLAGDDIPISARLMALADVYDALISKRVYKPSMSHEEAVGIMVKGRGSHFDPDIFDAFREIEQEFIQIAARYQDH